MPSQTEAFAALRAAGLKHDDPDLVRLFDLSAPDYVARARAAKPELFRIDARVMSRDEYAAAKRALTTAAAVQAANARARDATARTLERMTAKHGKH